MKKQQGQSMEQKIDLRFILMGFSSLLLTALLCGAMFHAAFTRQIWQDLASETGQVARVCAYLPDSAALTDFAADDLRITLIAPTGEVLFESDAAGELENHLSRPEVQAALANGKGQAVRDSQTLQYNTYYYAQLLPNGNVLRLARRAAGIYAVYNAALPAVCIGCLFVLAASVALSILLTRQLVRPIMKMSENLDDLGHAAPYRELQPFMDALAADRRLRDSNAQMRRDFTANVSHELKTPLTSISGYAELIATGLAKPADTPAFGLRIQTEAQRMLRLVGDIIQLSELDSLSAEPEPETAGFAPVDLLSLAKSCSESLSVAAQKAFLTLEVTGPRTVVNGDANLLEELCYNLGDNAIRYNRPGGRVTLAVGVDNGVPFLRVTDTGIGIPPESQSRVFERFYRVDKSRSKATGGTGLGLAIVKHIVLLHGARIHLESNFGAGTAITVLFDQDAKARIDALLKS